VRGPSVAKASRPVNLGLLGDEDPHAAAVGPGPVGAEAGGHARRIAAEFAGKGIGPLEMLVAPPGDLGAADPFDLAMADCLHHHQGAAETDHPWHAVI